LASASGSHLAPHRGIPTENGLWAAMKRCVRSLPAFGSLRMRSLEPNDGHCARRPRLEPDENGLGADLKRLVEPRGKQPTGCMKPISIEAEPAFGPSRKWLLEPRKPASCRTQTDPRTT